ncbi:ABC transporter ATP-binding protein [Spirochaeta africana]|uniref:ABC-type multidrug transport system, ATPase component n=1 Tax=Spirochaeta africana (strain ATCC 700263 / DSM 8902 / Z-7692) TaxID=889378 RepID=H9UG85_SPIAZ|nr:ABC transporter ATP-binding protein [Spirochaeta africana]AFG36528.1 ABC-type multidrug transport system, ATPase component [Spirochaeta africana DSM 8902]
MTISINQLVKRYGSFTAVDHIDLQIPQGEICGLLGPNGAGKTTTIKCIAGLHGFDAGRIEVFGLDRGQEHRRIQQRIGLVPQEVALYEDLSAYENALFFGRMYGLRGQALRDGVKQALEFTELWERRDQRPKQYSGGMKRRLNIACALVHSPELIILDEPTVGIDPQSRNHILESIRELNRRGTTVLYTSHYMEEVEAICSRVAIIDHGRVIADGSKEEVKNLIAEEEQITVAADHISEATLEAIRNMSGVLAVTHEEATLRIAAQRQAVRVGQIIERLSAGGAELHSVQLEQPSLEGVFLTLTGRSLRD